EQAEVSLRRGALVGAVHREVAVSNRVDAGSDHLPAAVGAFTWKPQDAQKSSLLDTERNGGIGGLAGRNRFRQPDFAPRSGRSYHTVALILDGRPHGSGQTRRCTGNRFDFIILSG